MQIDTDPLPRFSVGISLGGGPFTPGHKKKEVFSPIAEEGPSNIVFKNEKEEIT
jgi:hypothetical protein